MAALDVKFQKLNQWAWSTASQGLLSKFFTGNQNDWKKKSLNPTKSELKAFLFSQQHYRCAYCRGLIEDREGSVEIDHIVPKDLAPKCTFETINLVLACKRCNNKKRTHNTTHLSEAVLLSLASAPTTIGSYNWVHPFLHCYSNHISVTDAYVYSSSDPIGLAVITQCRLSDVKEVEARRRIAAVVSAGNEDQAFYSLMAHCTGWKAARIASEFLRLRPNCGLSLSDVSDWVKNTRAHSPLKTTLRMKRLMLARKGT
jgi:hypothetical protein